MFLTRDRLNILIIEDNEGDIRLIEEAFQELDRTLSLNVVVNGEDAISYLKKEGQWSAALRPDIILLDLNLPGIGGGEVLSYIKKDKNLRAIPVIILSNSSRNEDIAASYQACASCYIVKPLTFQDYINMMKVIEQFWFNTVILPN